MDGKQDGDQPAHDVGVAVAGKAQDRFAPAVAYDVGQKPHLARASGYLVCLGPRSSGQRLKGPSQLDDVTIPILPVIEQSKVRDDFVDRHDGDCHPGPALATPWCHLTSTYDRQLSPEQRQIAGPVRGKTADV